MDETKIILADEANQSYAAKITLMQRPSRASSGIWEYFGLAEKEEGNDKGANRLICLLCYNNNTIHVYMKTTSSGNLWRHLNRVHGIAIPANNKNKKTRLKRNRKDFESNHYDPLVINDDDGEFKNAFNISNFQQNGENSKDIDIGNLLIVEISKRPQLYIRGQSKKAERDKLWNEIYEALDKVIEVDHLQRIWKNIRDRYKKLKNNKSQQSVDVSKYKYYNQLQFLNDCDLEDSISSNNYEEEFLKTITSDESEIIVERADIKDGILPLENTNNINPLSDHYQLINEAEYITDVTTTVNNDYNDNGDNLTKKQKFCDCDCSNYDEFDLFGKFIAEKLRKLPKSKSENIEIEIMKILKDEN